MPSAFKTTAACLQLRAGWSRAADADLIGLSSFVISQTDGAESLYTKQAQVVALGERPLFGCSVIRGNGDASVQRMNHVIGKNAHVTNKSHSCFEITKQSHAFDYKSVVLPLLLSLYLIHEQCCMNTQKYRNLSCPEALSMVWSTVVATVTDCCF